MCFHRKKECFNKLNYYPTIYRVSHKEIYTFDCVLLVHLTTNFFETLHRLLNNQVYKKSAVKISALKNLQTQNSGIMKD